MIEIPDLPDDMTFDYRPLLPNVWVVFNNGSGRTVGRFDNEQDAIASANALNAESVRKEAAQ